MSRAPSLLSSHPARTRPFDLESDGGLSTVIAAWQQDDAPVNASMACSIPTTRRFGSQQSPLPQVDESDTNFGLDASEWLSRIGDDTSAPSAIGPDSHNTSYLNTPLMSEFQQYLAFSNPSSTLDNGFPSPNLWSASHSAALTNGTTATSEDMSRQQSPVGSTLCEALGMVSFDSIGLSENQQGGEGSPVDNVQSFTMGSVRASQMFQKDLSLDLRGAGAFSEMASASGSLAPPMPLPTSTIAEEMERSGSNNSTSSTSSSRSARQRRQEQLANAKRRIAPKSSDEERTAQKSRIASASSDSSAGNKRPISKQPYRRPKYARQRCPKCNLRPEGFSGVNELKRHYENKHGSIRKGYVCIDVSRNQTQLANCKACRTGKTYNADYNAAAHLRRVHFKFEGCSGVRETADTSDKKTDATQPSMVALRPWIKEVMVGADSNGQIPVDKSNDETIAVDSDMNMGIDQDNHIEIALGQSLNTDPTDSINNILFPSTDCYTTDPTSDLSTRATLDGTDQLENNFDASQVTVFPDFFDSYPDTYPMNDQPSFIEYPSHDP